jgi:D-glycero-D-manno-heptose 1,7-bisphosphate phosphatase
MSESTRPSKALFLDRDGVVNEDTGYPQKPEQIVFRPGIFELCRTALEKGYTIVVVTNQAGVAKGKFTEDDVRELHAWMQGQFAERGIPIAGFYYCPFHPQATVAEYRRDSDLRKPKPGMILQAARDLNLDVGSSVVIGDKVTDRIDLKGLKSVVLRSHYTGDDCDVDTLEQAAALL